MNPVPRAPRRPAPLGGSSTVPRMTDEPYDDDVEASPADEELEAVEEDDLGLEGLDDYSDEEDEDDAY
jgi:hypothetical protein